ncbi:alanine racemase [Nocardioides insulae]|uniref:alanine racemase n=1 Tax=Nocardioides insulae TaxID=394734 RepID=UPI000414FC43|nr:alanine racemase [Nocardioides insulae]
MSRAEIVVDLAAIRGNAHRLREHAGTPLMAVVKADGYGHGLVESARAAREGGAAWLGVATIDEALALRAAGDEGRVLCWLTVPADDLAPVVAAGIDVSAYTLAELDQVADAVLRAGRPARLQIKVDTGLSRGGATPDTWAAVMRAARQGETEGRWRVTGVWSHLSSSDEVDDPANDEQEKVFRDALAVADRAGLRPDVRHLANSAAAIHRPSSRFDLVRCGISLYGVDPAPGVRADVWDGLGLTAAMTVRADLALVKQVEAGAAVSYGRRWTAPAPTVLGLVPIGYADGLSRVASNRAEVWVAGERRPVRGTICMDQVVVDLGAPGVGTKPEAGADVLVFGPGTRGEPTAQDWAEAGDTIAYEVVTRVGGRMVRRHVDSERDPATTPEPSDDPIADPIVDQGRGR